VEDLNSKLGTVVNEEKIKGEKCVITQDNNTLKMGSMAGFRITWFPVVLSFSFTAKQLQADIVPKLRASLEQLDIKFLSEYDFRSTTHVVSKKRNTSKGLQALVNGKYIVNDKFVDAIVSVATPEQADEGHDVSALEGDFDSNWPDAQKFLPDPGSEPVPRPADAFAPNPGRAELFDGYTFIFYEKEQYNSLIGPISNGKGKALYTQVVPQETQIDDFIRYVKSIAGEKGLGEFEDGSEGRGVVVVRYLPQKTIPPEDQPWFLQFYTSVSLRLDHRLVDQKDFLDAILGGDASVLRRPLEVENQRTPQNGSASSAQEPMDDGEQTPIPAPPSQVSAPRRRVRGAAKSRFKGFVMDVDSDGDGEVPGNVQPFQSQSAAAESSQDGLFVSQDPASSESHEITPSGMQSQRKRPASHISQELDIGEEFAPTAAQIKRRRIAAGEDPIPRQPTRPEAQSFANTKSVPNTPKGKKEINIMEIARQNQEEAEARAQAEREALNLGADDIDPAEIRRLQIEEPMEIREAPAVPGTRDVDLEDGRWDPAWNGRKNFKKFQQRGAVSAARPPERIIIQLEESKTKGFGIGDDYWLEDGGVQKRRAKGKGKPGQTSHATSQDTSTRDSQSQRKSASAASSKRVVESSDSEVLGQDDEDDDDEDDDIVVSSARMRTKTTAGDSSRSQRTKTTQTTQKSQPSRMNKRPAAAPPAKELPAKRSKVISIPASDEDDESEDELRFRFRKR
jgi:hypothetical protein